MQLLEKNQIELDPLILDEKWKYEAYKQFSEKLSDSKNQFPCIPATIGFKRNQFRYGFLSDPRLNRTVVELVDLLQLFGEESITFGKYTSLIVIFDTPDDLIKKYTVADYRGLFWTLLSKVSQLDDKEWPSHIPQNPENHVWEYCFGGEQYFMYCATPAHKQRKSRHFPYFIFAITPRWVLEEFHSLPDLAEKMRKSIRERISKYDTVGIHPDLNLYGNKENFEWKQYFLSDDSSTSSRCPFNFLYKSYRG
jgi:FPC/CPF motif-containing protein YcgG